MPGATAIGITYQDGIILAAEKRISYGNFVVNKNTKKIFPITDQVASACAGMVADMQVLTRQVGALAKIRKLETKREMATNSVAKLMSVIMFERRYFPLLTQVIVGGVHTIPEIYTLDPLGSLLPDNYAAVGTGAELALGLIDSEYKKNMTEDASKKLAIKAINRQYKEIQQVVMVLIYLTITKKGIEEESMNL